MKKKLLSTLLLLAAFAATADVTYYIGTEGEDKYQDGTYVLDGEFYALVWSSGETFAGFNADATLVDQKNNKVIVARPYASERHLEEFSHQVSNAEDGAYSGGVFHIVLLDTRKADGTLPPGGDARQLTVVNGYAAVKSTPYEFFKKTKSVYSGDVITVSDASSVPAYAPQPPVVTRVLMRDDKFVMVVTNTASYLRYKAKGVDIGGSAAPAVNSTAADGLENPNQEIEIEVPVTDVMSNGFFKVIRK